MGSRLRFNKIPTELKKHRDFLKQNREKIIADIKAGMSADECVKKWGISKNSYGQYKSGNERRRGKDLKDLGRPMKPEERRIWLEEIMHKEEEVFRRTGGFNFIVNVVQGGIYKNAKNCKATV
jgi:hypothetical protein